MTKNLLTRVLAAALCAALPLPSFAQSVAKAPTPVSLSAAAVAAPSVNTMPVASGVSLQALTPVLAAPSIAPALTPALSAPAAALAAKPILEGVAAKVTAAKPGSSEAAGALSFTYNGQTSAASAEPVLGSQTALKAALKPAASAPDAPRGPTGPGAPRSGKAKIGVIAAIVGAVAIIGVIVAIMINNGNAKNKEWESSKASAEVVQIDAARRSGDAATLFKLEAGARERQKTKQDPDGKKAKTLDAFDGLVAMRGGANGNAVSTNPQQRPGGALVATWKDRLVNAEAQARQTGNVGALARTIAELRAEITKEGVVASVYEQDLRKFQSEVPTFGGAMGKAAAQGQADLNEFKAEASAEQALADQYTSSMRSIVTHALAATDGRFAGQLERADRLQQLAGGQLSTLDDLADKIDANLKEMAEMRRAQKANLDEAKLHTADPVLDANGKPVLDAEGKPKTVDNSGLYKDKAAQNALDAVAAAGKAKSNIEAFNSALKAVRSANGAKAEGLDNILPRQASNNARWNERDLLDPWTLDDALKNFTETEAVDARARFGNAKGQVTSAQQTVDARRQEVKRSIDETVDREIERQTKGW